jgi:hypothetical protein
MAQDPSEALPPHAALIQMATAHWVSHMVRVAADLGLADLLATGPKTAEELAGPTKTHGPSLYRLMRTLGMVGLFAEDGSRRFALTPLGEALKTGAPGAARSTILTLASDWCIRGFAELRHSIETGKPGFDKTMGMPIFDWLTQHPKRRRSSARR